MRPRPHAPSWPSSSPMTDDDDGPFNCGARYVRQRLNLHGQLPRAGAGDEDTFVAGAVAACAALACSLKGS